MLKITSAQINPTVGDIDGNIALMLDAARTAQAQGSKLVVFPELSLCGYYPGDLLDERSFLDRVAAGIEKVKQATTTTPGLFWIVGAPLKRTDKAPGKRLNNALMVLRNGEVVRTYAKQLLPTYGIFDERRHFEPGPDKACVFRIGSTQIGVMICEDGWDDEGQDYAVNPYTRLADASPDLVISINASPSQIGKRVTRHEVFSKACGRHGLPMLYVNQVGGQDDLTFDGASFAVNAKGKMVFEADRFVSDIRTLCFDPNRGEFFDGKGGALAPVAPEGLPVMKFYKEQIGLNLQDYTSRCTFPGVIVGSSGGIDSAVVIALSALRMGGQNVLAITMPSDFSSEGSVSDSKKLCENLGVKLIVHPIADIVNAHRQQYERATGKPLQGVALENLQARVRGTILMEYSNTLGYLVLTTGNKSEISVGYCTLYGDTNGGLGLIGDLYKTEVFALARYINESEGREIIPVSIIDKPPSAELAPGQKDTDSLPPYEILDEILKIEIEGERLTPAEYANARETVDRIIRGEIRVPGAVQGQALIDKIRKMISRNEYKRRQAAPIVRVRSRAFGAGRQMPIAAVHY